MAAGFSYPWFRLNAGLVSAYTAYRSRYTADYLAAAKGI
jgi:hypothetical protein